MKKSEQPEPLNLHLLTIAGLPRKSLRSLEPESLSEPLTLTWLLRKWLQQ